MIVGFLYDGALTDAAGTRAWVTREHERIVQRAERFGLTATLLESFKGGARYKLDGSGVAVHRFLTVTESDGVLV